MASDRLRFRRRRIVLLCAFLLAVGAVTGLSVASAAPAKPYSATELTNQVGRGSAATVVLRITNETTVSQPDFGGVNVTIPTGFQVTSVGTTTELNGAGTGKSWTSAAGGSVYTFLAATSADRLTGGESLLISLTGQVLCSAGSTLTFATDTTQANRFNSGGNRWALMPGSDTTVAVVSGAATKLGFDTISSPQQAGVAFQVTVRALDDCDAQTTLTGAGTLSGNLSSEGASNPSYGALQFANGVATASVTAVALESGRKLTAQSGSLSGESNEFAVGAGPATALSVDGPIGDQVVGQSFTVHVSTVDQFGHPNAPVVGGTTVKLTPATGTGTLGGTTSVAIASNGTGGATFSVSYSKVENDVSLHAATIAGTSLTADNSNQFDVLEVVVSVTDPGPNTTLSTSPQGASVPCETDTRNLVCITVFLANGATDVFTLQEGACDTADLCLGSSLSGIFGNLKDENGDPLYSATNPLRYTIEFDKSITRNRSPNDVVIEAMFGDETSFHVVQDCKTPGVVNPLPERDCVDKSYRDGSADTIKEIILWDDWIARGH